MIKKIRLKRENSIQVTWNLTGKEIKGILTMIMGWIRPSHSTQLFGISSLLGWREWGWGCSRKSTIGGSSPRDALDHIYWLRKTLPIDQPLELSCSLSPAFLRVTRGCTALHCLVY